MNEQMVPQCQRRALNRWQRSLNFRRLRPLPSSNQHRRPTAHDRHDAPRKFIAVVAATTCSYVMDSGSSSITIQ